MTPLPPQRQSIHSWETYQPLWGEGQIPFHESWLYAPLFVHPDSFLLGTRSGGLDFEPFWPPPPDLIPHTIEWLMRLTPLPHSPLLARATDYSEFPCKGGDWPHMIAEHLLWLLENP